MSIIKTIFPRNPLQSLAWPGGLFLSRDDAPKHAAPTLSPQFLSPTNHSYILTIAVCLPRYPLSWFDRAFWVSIHPALVAQAIAVVAVGVWTKMTGIAVEVYGSSSTIAAGSSLL